MELPEEGAGLGIGDLPLVPGHWQGPTLGHLQHPGLRDINQPLLGEAAGLSHQDGGRWGAGAGL